MQQQSLFKYKLLKTSRLVADSPRQAFYDLFLEFDAVCFVVRKESGIRIKSAADGKMRHRVLDRRRWFFAEENEAARDFERKLKDKINPKRKSPRKYFRLE